MGKSPKKTLPSAPKQEHPFIEPRFLAAGSVLGLGIAVGWGLMFAHILIVLGLIIALASAVGVISIYAKHFENLYVTIKKKQKYEGAGLIELLVSVVVVTIVIVVSPIIYSSVKGNEIILSRAEIQLDGIFPAKQPGFANDFVNVQWRNHGTLTLTNGKMDLKGKLWNSTQPIPKEQITPELDKTRKAVDALIKQQKSNMSDALFGQSLIVTIPDFVISDADWVAVQQGLASIYVFYSIAYQDDAVANKGFWRGDFCAYFTYSQNYYHNCGLNHIALE